MGLQVAIKNSLDVFYFNVPFDLAVVLVETAALTRDQFTQVWQRVGDGGQSNVSLSVGSMDSESIKRSLAFDNVQYVAQRQADGATLMYMSAMTCNNCTITAEVSVPNGGGQVRIGTRTETSSLLPIFEASVTKRLTG